MRQRLVTKTPNILDDVVERMRSLHATCQGGPSHQGSQRVAKATYGDGFLIKVNDMCTRLHRAMRKRSSATTLNIHGRRRRR